MNTEKFSDSKPVIAYTAGALSLGANNGNGIDTQFYNSLTCILRATITTGEIDSVTWEESDDDGSTDAYAAVPAVESLSYPGSFPLTGAGAKIIHCGVIGKKRYVRPVITTSGTVSIALDSMDGLLQCSLTKPMVKESSVLADADVIAPGPTADAATTPPKRT